MLEIEFFHDVICSFCFPMSNRMRNITDKYNNLKITHRSFALAWEVSNLESMFGSHEAAKEEVLKHWQAANQNDDEHRFNIEGMSETPFNFPHSQPGLLAAKAAVIADLQRVSAYGIQGAPALVINQKYLVSGAQPQAVVEQAIKQAAEEAGIDITKAAIPKLQSLDGLEGMTCRIEDGQWICD